MNNLRANNAIRILFCPTNVAKTQIANYQMFNYYFTKFKDSLTKKIE